MYLVTALCIVALYRTQSFSFSELINFISKCQLLMSNPGWQLLSVQTLTSVKSQAVILIKSRIYCPNEPKLFLEVKVATLNT